MASLDHLDQLRMEARYNRNRRDLYRAKFHSRRPTSVVRLKELERICQLDESRIRRLERELDRGSPSSLGSGSRAHTPRRAGGRPGSAGTER
jgi:hypothetical protein